MAVVALFAVFAGFLVELIWFGYQVLHHDYTPPRDPAVDFDILTESDPDFSLAVFEDFVYDLYAAAQLAATDRVSLARVAPYVSAEASAELTEGRRDPVQRVVIPVLRIEKVARQREQHKIWVRIEASLATAAGALSCLDHWVFARDVGVKSRPPLKIRTWPCPNCGAPWSSKDGFRTCASCGETIRVGRFDWTVVQISLEQAVEVPRALAATIAESGDEKQTVRDPAAEALLAQITAEDPGVTWDALRARVEMIYAHLNDAWNQRNLSRVRGLVTRPTRDYLTYWLEAYERQGLASHLEDGQVRFVVLARTRRDRYYDEVTVRVYADAIDYTVDREGKVVTGSKRKRRSYSEYWTLLRSSSRRGAVTATAVCPNCGAPLSISEAGGCDHCGAELESAQFDFMLSRIQRDDIYERRAAGPDG